ncbi:MAG: DUF2804 domain-containing protein [Alcanivoracaceae bacterium]|nr:DUF2804 domain-containing protein [Alcanivoracaceae bacterium]
MTQAEQATAAQLVDDTGAIAFGIYPDTVAQVNGRDYDYRTPMGKPAGPLRKHFHYKQFQYFGIVSDHLLAGCAFADTAYLGLAFAYVFDTRTGTLHESTWRSPLARDLHMSASPVDGQSLFEKGTVRIALGYGDNGQGRNKSLTLSAGGLEINARLQEPPHYQPMSLCTRIGVNGWAYANKVAGVPVTGNVTYAGQTHDLGAIGAWGHHDFSAGYMRRETFWNWACLSGMAGGHQLGMNLSCGVNETSFTENCLWLDGKLIKVAGTTFDYDRDDLMAPWRVRSTDGKVDLTFVPAGRHRETLNLAVFASNFHQIFGTFQGTLHVDGRDIAVDRIHGFVEEQYAKW